MTELPKGVEERINPPVEQEPAGLSLSVERIAQSWIGPFDTKLVSWERDVQTLSRAYLDLAQQLSFAKRDLMLVERARVFTSGQRDAAMAQAFKAERRIEELERALEQISDPPRKNWLPGEYPLVILKMQEIARAGLGEAKDE